MPMQAITAVITRFQAATDALAAPGARLGIGPDPWPIPFGFVTGRKA
ncbi:MAG TPA: hypothetical protein VGF54_03400 [Streptosporangiaceae bacterium]|jgi:hypothetical protein